MGHPDDPALDQPYDHGWTAWLSNLQPPGAKGWAELSKP